MIKELFSSMVDMMELDPHYCSVIVERWSKLTGQEARVFRGRDSYSYSDLQEK